MACDFSILEDVDVLTEVVSITCGGIDCEVISRDFNNLPILCFALFNDSRLHAVDYFRIVEHGDREGVLSMREPQLVSGLEIEVGACAGVGQDGLVRTERVAPERLALTGNGH